MWETVCFSFIGNSEVMKVAIANVKLLHKLRLVIQDSFFICITHFSQIRDMEIKEQIKVRHDSGLILVLFKFSAAPVPCIWNCTGSSYNV